MHVSFKIFRKHQRNTTEDLSKGSLTKDSRLLRGTYKLKP